MINFVNDLINKPKKEILLADRKTENVEFFSSPELRGWPVSVLSTRPMKSSWEVNHADVEKGQKLGEGSYGVVYRGTWRETEVAIKQVKCDSLDGEVIAEFEAETEIMLALRHPNIVLLLGATSPRVKTEPPLLVMEWMAGGSLFDALHHDQRKRPVNEKKIALDVGQGLAYLHSSRPPILHRDLKSLNVLIDQQATSAKVKLFLITIILFNYL